MEMVPTDMTTVSITVSVIRYRPDLHRPILRIKTPTDTYHKLVPGVRTTTEEEAFEIAKAYRDQLIASGMLPPKSDRATKAKATV